MKSIVKNLLVATTIVSLVTLSAQANPTVIGSIWENDPTGAGDATPANVPGTTPDVTFSISGNIDLQSGPAYTIGEFLSSGGATVLTGAGELGNTADNTIYNFVGMVSVFTGETFIAGHDDGLTLIIDGATVISDPGPTSFNTTAATYSGPTGTFPFQLVYGECCGAPADLEVTLPFQSTVPDGGSTMVLLGGALTMMGMVTRRFRK